MESGGAFPGTTFSWASDVYMLGTFWPKFVKWLSDKDFHHTTTITMRQQ